MELRARFAVGIVGRSASARRDVLILEAVSIRFQVLAQVTLFAAREGVSFNFQFDCTGIVLSILVLCFLGSAWWWDR